MEIWYSLYSQQSINEKVTTENGSTFSHPEHICSFLDFLLSLWYLQVFILIQIHILKKIEYHVCIVCILVFLYYARTSNSSSTKVLCILCKIAELDLMIVWDLLFWQNQAWWLEEIYCFDRTIPADWWRSIVLTDPDPLIGGDLSFW